MCSLRLSHSYAVLDNFVEARVPSRTPSFGSCENSDCVREHSCLKHLSLDSSPFTIIWFLDSKSATLVPSPSRVRCHWYLRSLSRYLIK